jgi:hypothetical protein
MAAVFLLLRPALPWLALAALILALLGGIYLAGMRRAEERAEAARQRAQIETLQKERDGAEAAADARRDGAAGRLRDGRF